MHLDFNHTQYLMKNCNKVLLGLIAGSSLFCLSSLDAAPQKILSVDMQKVLEEYKDAQAARTAMEEAVKSADNELKEMYDAIVALNKEIDELNEKAENAALLDDAREKFKKEAEDKTEVLHEKEGEFMRFRQDVSKKFSDKQQKDMQEQDKAIKKAAAEIAKSKKADIILNKFPSTLYIDDSLDITQLLIDRLNSK